MFIHIETATTIIKRKILNFQIAGNEIHVNYKIGTIKTNKMAGTVVSETIKAVVQADIVKLKTSQKITVVKDSEIIYSYEKKPKENK